MRAFVLLLFCATALGGCADDSDLQAIDGGSTTPRPWSPDPAWGNGTTNGTGSATTSSSYPAPR